MLFKNPIWRREIKCNVRDPKIIAMVSAFVTLLGLILAFLWPKTGVYSQQSDVGLQVFSIFLVSNLTLIILLVPALTSPAITTEREANSYELLFTSLMSPGEILRGKLFSSLSMVLLLVLVSMPITALCSLSGGIPPSLLIRAVLVIVVSAFCYGMVGLAISALCKGTFVSLISSYLVVIGLAGCTWLPSMLAPSSKRFALPLTSIRCLSPFDAMISILYPTRYQQSYISDFAGNNPYFFFYIFLLGNIIVFAICLFIFCKYVVSPPHSGMFYKAAGIVLTILLVVVVSIESVVGYDKYKEMAAKKQQFSNLMNNANKGAKKAKRNPAKQQPIPRGGGSAMAMDGMNQFYLIVLLMIVLDLALFSIAKSMFQKAKAASQQYEDHYEDGRTNIKRKLTWPFYLIDPLKRKKPIGRFRNPVFVAEMRSQLFARPRFIIYGLVTCISISMLLLIMACLQFGEWVTPDQVMTVAIIFQVAIISVLAPSISSGAITNELTARTFPMLRMTPMPATRMVFGKLKASFVYVSIFLLSSLPVLFSLAFLDFSKEISGIQAFWRVGAWMAILLVVTMTFITGGFCCSAFSKNTGTATALSYCFAATICIVTLAGLIPDALPQTIQYRLLMLNPIVVAVRLVSDEMFNYLPDNAWQQNIIQLGILCISLLVVSCLRVYYIFIRRT